MQTPRIQTIWQNSRIHHIDRGGVKNTSAESNFTFRACVRNENDNCLRIPFRKMSGKALAARGFEPPWGKRKVPAFVSKAGTSEWLKKWYNPGLPFCNTAFVLQWVHLGATWVLPGATPSFRFAICCFAHICPVSGITTEWGCFLDHVVKSQTCGKQGLVWVQNNGGQ